MRRIAITPRGLFTGLIIMLLASGALAAGTKAKALKPLQANASSSGKSAKPSGSTSQPANARAGNAAASGVAPSTDKAGDRVASTARSPLAERIDRLVKDPGLGKMRVGIRVESLGSQGGLVYESNSREPLHPASCQKLVASSAALCMLPSDFKYRTAIGRLGRDLVIIGAGDPGFGDPRLAKRAKTTITGVFHDWAERLKAAGITRIDGDLIFDDFVFDQQHMHPKWPSMFNLQDWYTAPVGGLNFNDNCVDVVVRRGPANGAPAEVILVPPSTYCTVENKAVTGAKGEPAIRRSGDGPIKIVVTGQVSRSASPDAGVSLPISDPGMFFASAARTALAAKGIEITGATRRQRVREADGMTPAGLQILAIHEQTLPELLWRMNTTSLNMTAEAMLKTLGAYSREGRIVQEGSLATGRAAVAKFLGSLGMSENLYVMDDGSGLSRDNRNSAIVFTAILKHMDAHPQREVWWQSLAEAGDQAGSLKRRMKDLGDKVFAKTGHISNVSTLSGYVLGPNSRRYAFSVLCNDTSRAKGGGAHGLQDGLCRLLATWNQ